jgi:nucleoside-diphosphate-sugar epimerase
VDAGDSAFVTGGSGFIGGRLIRRLENEGLSVKALARSDAAAAAVEAAGAEAVRGDLNDETAIRDGARGCRYAFHAAARAEQWGDPADFERVNVGGTETVLRACRAAGVERFVHIGTEAALLHGKPLVNANEDWRLHPESKALYSATKARAERAVRTATAPGFDTVVVRPRFVWGPGDTTVLPGLVKAVESGRFAWIGGGRHLTSTTHVDNAVEGLVLAADRGRPGAAYFVTDGEPVVFREWVERLLATRGIEVPDRSVPRPLAAALAAAGEAAWRLLGRDGEPPLTRLGYWMTGLECTLDDSRAREELGYVPPTTRESGLNQMSLRQR